MQYQLFTSERYELFCLGSGSCGNSYYLGNSTGGILIDAGIGPRLTKKRLAENGIDLAQIQAVLITHDHFDHIKSVGFFTEKMFLPIYTTREVHRGIRNCPLIHSRLDNSICKYVEKGKMFKLLGLKITPFEVPHDSTDNVGYSIEFDNHRLVIATDVGIITDEMAYHFQRAHHLIIESNYDEEMLRIGNYPYQLKRRITSGHGHLSNRQTAEYLSNNFSSNWRNICLCHLSGDNNNPEVAYQTTQQMLSAKGIEIGRDIELHIFKRNVLSTKIIF